VVPDAPEVVLADGAGRASASQANAGQHADNKPNIATDKWTIFIPRMSKPFWI
jgi:hypothetical protein